MTSLNGAKLNRRWLLNCTGKRNRKIKKLRNHSFLLQNKNYQHPCLLSSVDHEQHMEFQKMPSSWKLTTLIQPCYQENSPSNLFSNNLVVHLCMIWIVIIPTQTGRVRVLEAPASM